jgi:hypothetical protein
MVVFPSCSFRLKLRLLPRLFAFAFSLAFLLASAPAARADILFEGYSKVLLDNVHVGYVVQRYEFDPKKKEFSTTYFLKTNAQAGNITESLKARADAGFKPIAYQYTELTGDSVRTIDATFKGDTMTAVIKDPKHPTRKEQTLHKTIPKGAFLSSFLGYVMLQGPEGIKKGAKYSYKAIAEEDGNLYDGEAYVSGQEMMNGVNAFKVLNTFKGAQFASWVTHKGEVIATRSPVQKIATELAPSVQEATAGHPLNSNSLSILFGSVPKGTENVVAKRGTEAPPPAPTPETAKKEGVPGGQGVIIKGAPPLPSGTSEEKAKGN